MARPKNAQKSQENLIDRSALDKPSDRGGTRSVGVLLSVEDIDWLDTFPDGRSYHIRQAIALYQALKEVLEWLNTLEGSPLEHIRKAIALYRQHLEENK